MGVRRVVLIVVLLSSAVLAAVPAARAYTIPPDNPFVSTPGARGEIYVWGLRNPFRWSFDRATGDMVIGDVGQGKREEIGFLPRAAQAGVNLGWVCREGTIATPGISPACNPPGAVGPTHDYENAGGNAVIGGFVVRDPDLPAWQGRYLFGDIAKSTIKWLGPGAAPPEGDTGLAISAVSGFGEDGLGHLYATSLGGGVYRLRQVSATKLAGDSIGSFDRPMAVAAPAGDPDRLFIAERGGTLRLRTGGQVHDFLSVLTTTDGERGLLSVAVAPDYATSGRVYVFYTDPAGNLTLDEFRRSATDPNRADPATRLNLLTIPHTDASNHNGGSVHVGPDGYLYVSTGDGGSGNDPGNDAQRLDSLLGKILRIDPGPGAGGGGPGTAPVPPGDVKAPVVRTRVPARQRVLKLHGAVAYLRCDEVCRITVGGRLRIGKRRYELNTASRAAGANQRVRVKATLTKHARRALRRGLRHGRHPTVRLSFRGRDTAGNVGALKHATVRVRRR